MLSEQYATLTRPRPRAQQKHGSRSLEPSWSIMRHSKLSDGLGGDAGIVRNRQAFRQAEALERYERTYDERPEDWVPNSQEGLARHELDRRGARRRGHHGVDVASAVAPILRAVRGVNLMVYVGIGLGHEGDVLADTAGRDVAFMVFLGRTEPCAAIALP